MLVQSISFYLFYREEEQIKKAIEKNEFLTKILSSERLKEIIQAMQPRRVSAKKTLIKQGIISMHASLSLFNKVTTLQATKDRKCLYPKRVNTGY